MHAHNEASRVRGARRLLEDGRDIALISDAGTPLVADPGHRLARAALSGGARLVPVPGPSAVLAALVVSGLPTTPFAFLGFLPRGRARRLEAVRSLAARTETTVFFESSLRAADALELLVEVGAESRPAALCRELTKLHEEVRRGTASELLEGVRERPLRGEVACVLGGAEPAAPADISALKEIARSVSAEGLAPGAAARRVARRAGVSRGEAYRALLDAKEEE